MEKVHPRPLHKRPRSIHFKIPAFMPPFPARFWDSLFAKSHESSKPCSIGIPTFLRAHHLPKSHVLSAPMELRIHWIYPRKCGIFDLSESRTLSERRCRNALKTQAFLQILPQSFRPFWKQDRKYRKCGFPRRKIVRKSAVFLPEFSVHSAGFKITQLWQS